MLITPSNCIHNQLYSIYSRYFKVSLVPIQTVKVLTKYCSSNEKYWSPGILVIILFPNPILFQQVE